MRCVSDSRESAFDAAHGVVIWSGPDHRRGTCLPPQRAEHTWVLEFSEPADVDPLTTSELYSEAFMGRFEVKVSHERSSDVVLTALHPLVEGGVISPDRWLNPASQQRAMVWLASPKKSLGCSTSNRRDELVRRLERALGPTTPVHSVGRCLHNHDHPVLQGKQSDGGGNQSTWMSKIRVLSEYAFCLITENSITHGACGRGVTSRVRLPSLCSCSISAQT
eukprot:4558990-Prymnesium_polylepis.1